MLKKEMAKRGSSQTTYLPSLETVQEGVSKWGHVSNRFPRTSKLYRKAITDWNLQNAGNFSKIADNENSHMARWRIMVNNMGARSRSLHYQIYISGGEGWGGSLGKKRRFRISQWRHIRIQNNQKAPQKGEGRRLRKRL